jgi:L-erythro-3,5-diaminohexanoate dehydrogenase
MRQIRESGKDIGGEIMRITNTRGKMHNPVTNSGGVLVGQALYGGNDYGQYGSVRLGKLIVPLVSLSAIPLNLAAVKSIDGDMVKVEGKAILFKHYPFAVVPDDMSTKLALSALDISSIVPQVERLIKPRMKMLVVGCGKAGLTAMAAARRRLQNVFIIAADHCEQQLSKARRLGYANYYWQIDASNAKQMYVFTRDLAFDLVVNCVNVPNTETSSIIAARPGGTVIFFSMATVFDKAALGTDATGKDVTMIIGNGVAEGQAEKMFSLLRADVKLLEYFEKLHGGE